jgi:hypothetical protein
VTDCAVPSCRPFKGLPKTPSGNGRRASVRPQRDGKAAQTGEDKKSSDRGSRRRTRRHVEEPEGEQRSRHSHIRRPWEAGEKGGWAPSGTAAKFIST